LLFTISSHKTKFSLYDTAYNEKNVHFRKDKTTFIVRESSMQEVDYNDDVIPGLVCQRLNQDQSDGPVKRRSTINNQSPTDPCPNPLSILSMYRKCPSL